MKIHILTFILLLNINTYALEKIEKSAFTEKKLLDKEENFNKKISDTIKNLLKQKRSSSTLSKSLTKKYYKYYKYKTFFIDENGIKDITFTLLSKIKNDPVLKPQNGKLFNLIPIERKIDKIQSDENIDIKELVDLDFALVSTYHTYMRYLARGVIDWDAFKEELGKLNEESEIIANWQKYSVYKNIRKLLYQAVEQNDIMFAINSVNFTFPHSDKLVALLNEYESLQTNGGFEYVQKSKKSLRKGNFYPQITSLRKRLQQSNYIDEIKCENEQLKTVQENNLFIDANKINTETIDDTSNINCLEKYDDTLFEAVKLFQKNHGLYEDGIIGKKTFKALNTPIEKRIKQIRINIERMRWMPRTLGDKFLIVNIPEYNLKMFKEGEVKIQMPVIVGEEKHPTPIFSHKISAIVLNPYWRIPQRIVKNEIIPKLVTDPQYLQKEEIKTFENWSHESMVYDTSAVDWSMYLDNDLIGNSKEAPMRFIQIPGSKNPLGRMKFMFPNRYSVYLHDTPFKHLFKKTKRTFSHGCIRLSDPHKLLETIALEDEVVDYKEAKTILKDIEKTDIDLKKKIPVHIVYLTAWVDENGQIQFRDDIYNYDEIHRKLIYDKEGLKSSL